jgi:sortase B
MKSGAMFAILRMYVWYDFYYSHKYITYVTEDGPYLITVFSAYNVSEVSDAWKIDFANDEEYAAWLKKVKAASQVPTDLTPTVDDRVVTLTTCSFVFDNARMVVHGVIEPLF